MSKQEKFDLALALLVVAMISGATFAASKIVLALVLIFILRNFVSRE